MKGFKCDNESRYFGYDLICNNCGNKIVFEMVDAINKKHCPWCGNEEINSKKNLDIKKEEINE